MVLFKQFSNFTVVLYFYIDKPQTLYKVLSFQSKLQNKLQLKAAKKCKKSLLVALFRPFCI